LGISVSVNYQFLLEVELDHDPRPGAFADLVPGTVASTDEPSNPRVRAFPDFQKLFNVFREADQTWLHQATVDDQLRHIYRSCGFSLFVLLAVLLVSITIAALDALFRKNSLIIPVVAVVVLLFYMMGIVLETS
jgi:hypothetical protein